jgi:hypothetical protein
MKKIIILFLTLAIVYGNTSANGVGQKVLSAIYQPSVVDALDPSRPRIA